MYISQYVTNEYKYCLGLAETTFKEPYSSSHKSSFKNGNSKNSMELTKYVWSLRENNKIPSIKWKVVKIVYCKATSSFCKLYFTSEREDERNSVGSGTVKKHGKKISDSENKSFS